MQASAQHALDIKGSESNSPKLQVERQHAGKLQEMGSLIIKKTGEVGTLYFDLCQYIRDNKLAPKLVSHELSQLGFHKVRVSEINRVAMASDADWTQFSARIIGFAKVLELTRASGGDVHSTPAAKLLVEGGAIEAEAIDSEVQSESAKTGSALNQKKPATPAMQMNRAAAVITKKATKPTVWQADGWILTLTKVKAKKKLVAQHAAIKIVGANETKQS